MADGNGVLLLEVRVEGSLVVDLEVKDSVLVRELEAGGVDGGCGGGLCDREGETVEGGEHGEFELEDVAGGWGEGNPFVPRVFGYFD